MEAKLLLKALAGMNGTRNKLSGWFLKITF